MDTKDLFPPILLDSLKKIRGLINDKEYASYSDAIKACSQNAYENFDLCNMIADKTLLYRDRMTVKPFTLSPTNVFLLSAINQYITVSGKKKVTVLDFGGACGAHYFELRRLIPLEIALEWYVIETSQMVKSAMDKKIGTTELHFSEAIEKIAVKIDFVHTSGALMYVPDPYYFINKLCSINAEWVFLNRMMFNKGAEDFITIQKSHLASNGPDVALPSGYNDRVISYPHTTMSFDKFNSAFLNNGYDLEWLFEEASGNHSIANYKTIGCGLLYCKKNVD